MLSKFGFTSSKRKTTSSATSKEYEQSKRKRDFRHDWHRKFDWLIHTPTTLTSGAATSTSGATTLTSGAATSTSGAATSTSGATTSTSGARDDASSSSAHVIITTSDTDSDMLSCKYCSVIYGVRGPLASSLPTIYHRYRGGPFVIGSCNMKLSSLKDHEVTNGHRYAASTYKARINKQSLAPLPKAINKQMQQNLPQLKVLFNTAHAIAKLSRPFTDFRFQLQLQEKNGVVVGKSYRTDRKCQEFIHAIAENERVSMVEKIESAAFVSIMSDGSQCVAALENEIVYLRMAIKGEIYVFFIRLVSVNKADAVGIYGALMHALGTLPTSSDISAVKAKIVCFGCDGASVNTGLTKGVIVHLRKAVGEWVLMVHCMAHRLELAYKDGLKECKLYSVVFSLLSSLFAWYKHYLQRANLKAAFESLQKVHVLPTRVGGTRWLQHTKLATTQVIRGYQGFVLHLEQVAQSGDSKAKGLLRQLKQKSTVYFMFFLNDLLTPLSSLSATMQRRDVTVCECHASLKCTLEVVNKLKTRHGYHLRSVHGYDELHGTALTGGSSEFDNQMPKAIDAVQKCMNARYGEFNSGVMAAMSIADFKTWPTNLEDDPDFGEDKVGCLMTHFREVLTKHLPAVEMAEEEWIRLRGALYVSEKKMAGLTWKGINEKYQATSEYQNVLLLIDLTLSISASTAECERGFRLLKQTKTDFRNRLQDSTCSDLMTVKMHTTDIDVFDPVPAIRAWDPSNRRPQQQSTAGQLSVCQCTTSTTACDHCDDSDVSLSEYTDSE